MLTNADITVYNSFLDPGSRMRVWHRTMIKGVWFYADNKVSLTDGGLVSADAYKVRIPVRADLVAVNMFHRMNMQGPMEHGH